MTSRARDLVSEIVTELESQATQERFTLDPVVFKKSYSHAYTLESLEIFPTCYVRCATKTQEPAARQDIYRSEYSIQIEIVAKLKNTNEINDKVKWVIGLDVVSRALLPFATQTRSPYQFWIDEYQRMREEDPLNATEKFYEKYGDEYYYFTTSLSKNYTGVAATVEADKRAKQLSDLIATNPEYGWFLVGDANAGEFSPTVYRNQREQAVAPGSTTTFRGAQDPYEAIAETNAERGWILYNKAMDRIEAERINRGLKSLESRGAEDLKQLKTDFIGALSQENPDWASVRGKIDTRKVMNFLTFADKATKDSRLSSRNDIKTMSEYLKGRDYVISLLSQRKSKNINNEENADLKEMWSAFTGALIDKDVTFNRVFTRILENDTLLERL